jgi:hypothetical protein
MTVQANHGIAILEAAMPQGASAAAAMPLPYLDGPPDSSKPFYLDFRLFIATNARVYTHVCTHTHTHRTRPRRREES